ncbi:unnamed protein product [Penicillium olsonii]|uniref:ubiquitinyl hydrolase 1 n=1 Tax=Penicillium olsonii TaxID=99116 RepID=A0A9W4HUR4_PENOL|nr:unnamed protein product [Penicillium olsonii]
MFLSHLFDLCLNICSCAAVLILIPFVSPWLPRAATRGAQLTVTTSSPKRRKVSPEPRPSPGPRARRHGRSVPPSRSRHASTSRYKSSSLSPPRYVPAHLQFQPQPGGRSLTPATATAGLTLSSEHSDMPSDTREGTPPTTSDGRSPSPGEKRSASEITDSDPEGGVSTVTGNARTGNAASNESTYPTPSSSGNKTDSSSPREQSDSETQNADASPSIDEQVAEVNELMAEPKKDGQKGYVVSMTWLKKVLARSTSHADHTNDSEDNNIGPVDNVDLVLDTDPAAAGFKDEAGEVFVSMRPGLHETVDFVIVPQQGWDLIKKWYGLAELSPIIVRYAHNVSQPGDTAKIEYEPYPPILSIIKLTNPAAGTTPTTLKEKDLPSAKTLTSRQTSFQKWLKEAKEKAGIDMSTKVRVWKIVKLPHSTTTSAAVTPATSRTASPAPPPSALIPSTADKLLLDLNAFLGLSEGTHRVLLEHVKDETNNPKYNGRMSLDIAGLGSADRVVLEEQVGGSKGGEWVSEASAKTLKRLGIPVELKLDNKPSALTLATKSPLSSGRSTPVGCVTPKNMFARGRKGRRPRVLGLDNLGNTCYMNSAIQCVRSIEELTLFFLSGKFKSELNPSNKLGCGGDVAKNWAGLLADLYNPDAPTNYTNPGKFRRSAGKQRSEFAGYDQHDSQEFVMFLLDALSEDLSRIGQKPYTTIPDSTDEMIHDRKALEEFGKTCWDLYESRNASVITDLFSGMYKSTLICPDCHKTSIIMDPFSTLTLPIPPGPQPMSRKITFVPQQGPPVSLNVQLDASDSLKTWKNFVGEQMGVDGARIFAAETHSNAFWKYFLHDDSSFESLETGPHDVLVFYDLGPVSESNEDDVVVPVFHRRTGPRKKATSSALFGIPSVIRLSHDEAEDLEAVYRKLLKLSNNMTTRDILTPEKSGSDDHAADDSDTVVTNEDDAQSADSRVKTSSVDGEDSIVDISMHDAQAAKPAEDTEMSGSDSESTKTPKNPLTGKIPAHLLALFDAKVLSSKNGLPDGRNVGAKDYPLLSSRIASPQSSRKNSDSASRASADNSDGYSDTDGSDEEPSHATQLLRQGDALVLDWSPEGHDSLFGGRQRDSEEGRGVPTYISPKNVYDHISQRRSSLKKSSSVTLDECLDIFSKSEVLSRGDTWYCPGCKDHVQATKKFDLWRAPDVMVVQLKRFGQLRRHHSKINTVVNFPLEGLDLTGRVQGPSDGKSLEYDLVAIDNHMGSMGGGHYTAYIKDFMSGDWYHCNDSSARLVTNPQTMIASSAYLLFYRRRSERPLGNKELQELVEAYKNPPGSESGASSPTQSPTGEGQRLGDSSRNGSSSALVGAGAAPRAGNGSPVENPGASEEYSTTDDSDADSDDGQGMRLTNNGLEALGQASDPLDFSQEPSWSFGNLTGAHAISQITPGNAPLDDSGLFDDDDEIDSNLAVGDDDLDPDTRMIELEDSHSVHPDRASFEDVSHLMDDDSDDELPVVELRVGDEDKMASD